jgi:hypothetical protein
MPWSRAIPTPGQLIVRTAEIPPHRDPDFDRPARTGPRPTAAVARYYQRLVLNPFLAVVGGCLTYAVARLDRSAPAWVLPIVAAGVVGAYFLLQYHCLDCGATGWYRGWRRHACPRVCERWGDPFSHGMPLFPSPATQLVLWFAVFVVALMIAGTAR